MARKSKGPRIMKTDEQRALLREMIKGGMTSGRFSLKIDEAMQKTGLPRKTIQQFVRSEKNTDRGSKYKSRAPPEKLTLYTSFLKEKDGFNGVGSGLGNRTKTKAALFQELKQTEEGRKKLQEIMDNQKAAMAVSQLSDAQKRNRALGSLDRVEKETDLLRSLGFKAALVASQPTRRPTLLGDEMAVNFFAEKPKLMQEFDRLMTSKVALTSKQRQKILRRQVQDLFNELYVKASGADLGSKMPYKPIEDGQVHITLQGLPDGIIFQRPKDYSIPQLESIQKNASNLVCSIEHELTPEPSPEPQNTQNNGVAQESLMPLTPEPSSEPQNTQNDGVTPNEELNREDIYEYPDINLQYSQTEAVDGVISVPHDSLPEALAKIRRKAEIEGQRRQREKEEQIRRQEREDKEAEERCKQSKKRKRGSQKAAKSTTKAPPLSSTLPVPADTQQQSTLSRHVATRKASSSTKTVGNTHSSVKPVRGQVKPPLKRMRKEREDVISPREEQEPEETLVGKKLQQLYIMEKEKGKKTQRKWFDGCVKEQTDGNYIIEFYIPLLPDEMKNKVVRKTTEISIISAATFSQYIKKGVIVFT